MTKYKALRGSAVKRLITLSNSISKRSRFVQRKRAFDKVHANESRHVAVPEFKQLVDLVVATQLLRVLFHLLRDIHPSIVEQTLADTFCI